MRRFIERIKLKIEKLKLDWQVRKIKRQHQGLLKEFEETRKERQELLKNWPPKNQNYCHTCWKLLPGESINLVSWVCPDCQKKKPSSVETKRKELVRIKEFLKRK
tara:strand:+ start:52 stop:366 length:315 start_codon:yes stop_codon:yes gene_type:complete